MTEGTRSATVRSVCPYCGVGCGVLIETDGRRMRSVRGDPDHPANAGRLCTKGANLHLTTGHHGRTLYPALRRVRSGQRLRATWPETLNLLADRFASTLAEHGPDAVAFYLSGQLLTEDYYAFNKTIRALIGTNNIDTNSRLCMSSAVTAYKATLGADAPPACYDDIELADLTLIVGANPAYAHPVLFRRIEASKAAHPERRIICVDPRRTDSAELADLHLQIKPGTDVALFNGLLYLLLWEDQIDGAYIAAHTGGFEDLRKQVRDYHPALVSELCGIAQRDLELAASWIAAASAMLSLYCQGLNQSIQGTAKNATLINLHLATGQIGKPGAGPLSLTGQPNAMGGREAGGMATLLPGHRDPMNAAHREELAALWQVPALPAQPGLTAVALFEAAARGEIKALWIACTNPAHSLPDQALVRAALERVDFVVLQDAFADTETAAFADVLLPAATWGEKSGTMTNSERRVARVNAAIRAPGEARADWAIALDFARALEQRLRPGQPSLFTARNEADLFAEHCQTTAGRDLDYSSLSHAVLDTEGPQQWPRPAGASAGTRRLYADGRFAHPDGRARFFLADYQPPAETTDAHYPLLLMTGRQRDHWHGMSRSGRVPALHEHDPEPALALNPVDLARRQLGPGDIVLASSRHGTLHVPVIADPGLQPGHAFMAMHWGERSFNAAGCNALIKAAVDPYSAQPELKATAIRIAAVDLPWRMVAMRVLDEAAPVAHLDALASLRARLPDFVYASCGFFGSQRRAIVLRAAAASAVDESILIAIDRALALDVDGEIMRYADSKRASERKIRLAGTQIAAFRISGNIEGLDWLSTWLDSGEPVAHHGMRLLGQRAPALVHPGSRMVCVCLGIDQTRIEACLQTRVGAPDAALADLKSALGCGTRCGSCLPELKRLVRETTGAASGMAP